MLNRVLSMYVHIIQICRILKCWLFRKLNILRALNVDVQNGESQIFEVSKFRKLKMSKASKCGEP